MLGDLGKCLFYMNWESSKHQQDICTSGRVGADLDSDLVGSEISKSIINMSDGMSNKENLCWPHAQYQNLWLFLAST